MTSTVTCDLCHEDTHAPAAYRRRVRVCPTCCAGIDYQDSLTPAERVAEESSIARHTSERSVDE